MNESYLLFIYQSNRAEVLAQELARTLGQYRQQAFCLEPDVVLVNNYEMAQWLAIQVAEALGICANVDFRLAGSFLWQQALGLSSAMETGVITKERLTWLIFRLLSGQDDESASGEDATEKANELATYIKRCPSQDLFSLSSSLADTFDRYLNYRPDMLRKWENGESPEEHRWQAWLWRRLSGLKQGRQFRVEYLSHLADGFLKGHIPEGFPKRLFVFGISHMPPIHMELLYTICRAVPVHLFLLNPCRRYWLDIRVEKYRAKAVDRLDHEGVDSLFPAGNPLLASMGQAGRAFLARLYGFEFFEGKDLFFQSAQGPDWAAQEGGKRPCLLHTIQDDILDLRGPETGQRPRISPGDDSIRVHSCHSALRQVEVLHDCLIHLFETNPDITPDRVLVMAPNMEDYAPLVRAVFEAAPAERRLPCFIADTPLDQSNQAVDAWLKVFSSGAVDITAPSLVDLLSLPVVMARYGIDEQDISIIRNWLKRSGARRGIEQLSSTLEVYENTLAFGLDRLYAASSYDLDPDVDILPEFHIAPYPVPLEGDDVRRLSALSAFIYRMDQLTKRLLPKDEKGFSIRQWGCLFDWMIQAFICQVPEDAESGIEELKQALSAILSSMEEAEIESICYRDMLSVVRHYLKKGLAPRSFITGRITFSNMVPMRALPFDVICLLGMNSGDFPRRPTFAAFDLVARDFRPGDRIPRDEDRYLFIETLLSARKKLWLFYEGRRQKDDAPLSPSVVVDELLSYIDERFRPPGEKHKSAREYVKIEHPLQPFSRRYLDGSMDGRHMVYNSAWCPLDEKGSFVKRRKVQPFCPEPIPLEQEEAEALLDVSPQDMGWFFVSPYRHFLMKRLSINAAIIDEGLEANEPETLGDRARILLLRRIVHLAKTGIPEDLEEIIRPLPLILKASGQMPPLSLGRLRWQGFVEGLEKGSMLKNFIKKKVRVLGVPETPLRIAGTTIQVSDNLDLEVNGLVGKINGSGTLLEYTDRKQISHNLRASMWAIDILLSYEMPEEWQGDIVIAVMGSTNLELNALNPEDAKKMAEVLARLYCQGLESPLTFMPRYSYPFAKEILRNVHDEDKLQSLMAENVPKELSQDVLEPVIKKLMKGSQFNPYMDRWQEYAFRTKRTGGIEALLWSQPFRKCSLEFFNGFFTSIRKGV